MKISTELLQRSESKCELCATHHEELNVYTVPPKTGKSEEDNVAVCSTCLAGINKESIDNPNDWRLLTESIWSPIPSVQVVSFRILQKLKNVTWAQDALSSIYFEEDVREWAEADGAEAVKHLDCNGVQLMNGDTVKIIQDLNVKGSSLTAKRGASVRNIRLVHDNADHIEGKVDGQHIVILTKYVKKA